MKQTLTFKNNFPNLTQLHIYSDDMDTLKAGLAQKLKQAPMMFIGMQIVVDLSALKTLNFDIAEWIAHLKAQSLNPIAIMSDNPAFQTQAIHTGVGALPVLKMTNTPSSRLQQSSVASTCMPSVENAIAFHNENKELTEPKKTFEQSQTTTASTDNQLIRHPIRSGQRIYARGDLTVIGQVSRGAEVIADGNIHIYGRLSGRAIAGAQGDNKAAIFCQKLDAELIAIAGHYKQLDDNKNELHNQPVEILLEGEKICFFSL